MATTTNVTTGFTGVLAGEILVQAFKKADTINGNAITVIPDVIGSGYLPKLSFSQGFTAYACGWNPNGTVTYVEKAVATKKLQKQTEHCKADYASTFARDKYGFNKTDAEIPTNILDSILLAITNSVAQDIDTQIWQGDNSTNQINGLLTQLGASGSGVIGVTGTTVTSSNVLAELEKVYKVIPDSIYNDPDLIMVVAPGIARSYKQALASQNSIGNFSTDQDFRYLGTRMVSIAGLPANNMLAYRVPNVAFLTGIESELNQVRVVDHDATALDGQVRANVVLTAGVGYSFAEEIVLYKP